MARIRSIKPEFWTSSQIVECSTNARLLFIGLWTFSDDAGRHLACTRRAKMEIFPGDAFTDEQVKSWIEELKSAKDAQGVPLLSQYNIDGCDYWQVTGWEFHQKIDQPTFRWPGPDGEVPCSPNRRRSFSERSARESSRVDRNDSIDRSTCVRVCTHARGSERPIDSIDHLQTAVEVDWDAVKAAAAATCRKLGLKAELERDRRLLLAAHALVSSGSMPEAWIADSVEGARLTKGKQQKPWAYLQKCLANKAKELRRDFVSDMETMEIPVGLLTRNKSTTPRP